MGNWLDSSVLLGYYTLDPENEYFKSLRSMVCIHIRDNDEYSYNYAIELMNNDHFPDVVNIIGQPGDRRYEFIDHIVYITTFLSEFMDYAFELLPEDLEDKKYLVDLCKACIDSITRYRMLFLNINELGDVLVGNFDTLDAADLHIKLGISHSLSAKFPNVSVDVLEEKMIQMYKIQATNCQTIH